MGEQVHLLSLQEPAVVPHSLLPKHLLGGEHSRGGVANLAAGCCNEITVSIFKECFIHYILEMYRKLSKN